METEEEQEAPVPIATHVNNILHSTFSDVKVYINEQQIYNSNRWYAQKSYTSNNFEGTMFQYTGALQCEGYNYENLLDEILPVPPSEPFFTKKMELLSRPDGFMLYGKLGVEFFSTFELPYPNNKISLRLIKARPIFYMISDNHVVNL